MATSKTYPSLTADEAAALIPSTRQCLVQAANPEHLDCDLRNRLDGCYRSDGIASSHYDHSFLFWWKTPDA